MSKGYLLSRRYLVAWSVFAYLTALFPTSGRSEPPRLSVLVDAIEKTLVDPESSACGGINILRQPSTYENDLIVGASYPVAGGSNPAPTFLPVNITKGSVSVVPEQYWASATITVDGSSLPGPTGISLSAAIGPFLELSGGPVSLDYAQQVYSFKTFSLNHRRLRYGAIKLRSATGQTSLNGENIVFASPVLQAGTYSMIVPPARRVHISNPDDPNGSSAWVSTLALDCINIDGVFAYISIGSGSYFDGYIPLISNDSSIVPCVKLNSRGGIIADSWECGQ